MTDLRETPRMRAPRAARACVLEHRRPSIPFSDAPRGCCRWCGEAILHGPGPKEGRVDARRRWHPACVDAYNATDPRELRRRVRRRDRGVCRACGLDTNRLRRQVQGRGRTKKLRELGFHPRRSLWELDHVVPLIEGGGHEPDNLQTLCVPCHRRKTAEEARVRAELRRSDEAASEASAPPAVKVERSARPTRPREPRPEAAAAHAADRLDELLARADAANARVEELLARS